MKTIIYITLGCICIPVMLFSCSQQSKDEKQKESIEEKSNQTNDTQHVPVENKEEKPHVLALSYADKLDSELNNEKIENTVDTYAESLKDKEILREILSGKKMSFEEISNKVARIDSKTIINATMLEYDSPVDRRKIGPEQYAAMMLYKIVYMRCDAPSWARYFALAEMLDYFIVQYETYTSDCEWAYSEAVSLPLPEDTSNDSFKTFLHIKLKLVRVSHSNEDCLKHISYLENLAKQGLVDPNYQPMQMMKITKARTLVEMRRLDEAYEYVTYLCNHLDELHPSLESYLAGGVDEFIRSRQKSDVYPELFDPKTGRRYDEKSR